MLCKVCKSNKLTTCEMLTAVSNRVALTKKRLAVALPLLSFAPDVSIPFQGRRATCSSSASSIA